MAAVADQTDAQSAATRYVWAAVAVVAVAAGLRFYHLDLDNLGLDETVSWFQSKDSFSELIARTSDDSTVPFYNFVLFPVIHLLGDSEWLLRMPAAVFGVGGVAALYWLGTLTLGRFAGLVAAALLTVSAFHIDYSQEGRFYTALVLAAVLYAATSFWLLQRATMIRAVTVALSGLALVHSHPYGVFNLISIALPFLIVEIWLGRGGMRTTVLWIGANVVIGLVFLPWTLVLWHRATMVSSGDYWFPAITADLVSQSLLTVIGSRGMAILLAVGGAAALFAPRGRGTWTLAVWTVGPVVIALAISVATAPMFHQRYIIASLPPLLLLAAFGLTRYVHAWTRIAVAVGLVAIGSVALSKTDPYTPIYPDHRGVAELLNAEFVDECAVVAPPWNTTPLGYYGWSGGPCMTPAREASDVPLIEADKVVGVFNAPLDDDSKTVMAAILGQGFVADGTTSLKAFDVVSFVRPGQDSGAE